MILSCYNRGKETEMRTRSRSNAMIVAATLVMSATATLMGTELNPGAEFPAAGHEAGPVDPPARVTDAGRRIEEAREWRRGPFTSIQVNVDTSGHNIIGDAANEPSIAVDPRWPNRIAIGWRQFDSVSSNFRLAGIGFSTDGGRS